MVGEVSFVCYLHNFYISSIKMLSSRPASLDQLDGSEFPLELGQCKSAVCVINYILIDNFCLYFHYTQL